MEDSLLDILRIQNVKGVIFSSLDGDILYERFAEQWRFNLNEKKVWWGLFIHSLNGIKRVEMVYDTDRLFIRQAKEGYLFVLASNSAPMAMIRLQCDLFLSKMEKSTKKGLNILFSRTKKV